MRSGSWDHPQRRRVVPVFIPGCDHHHPKPDDVAETKLNFRRIPRVAYATYETLCEANLALNLAQQDLSRVRTHVDPVETEEDWLAIEG